MEETEYSLSNLVREEIKTEQSKPSTPKVGTPVARLPSIIQRYPSYKVNLPISVNPTKIIEIFEKAAMRKDFVTQEKTSSVVTSVLKRKVSLKSIFQCFSSNDEDNDVPTLRLAIGINENRCQRTVLLKGLLGDPKHCSPVLKVFQKNIEKTLLQHQTPQIDMGSPSNHIGPAAAMENEEDFTLTCKNEATSYYQFHKILSDDSYTLGRNIVDFIKEFESLYAPDSASSLLPRPLHEIKGIWENTVDSLFSHYNFGKQNAEKTMQYCRPAVEKFVFSKMYSLIFPIYQAKMQETDEQFAVKQAKIREMSSSEIMNVLDIREKYRLLDEEVPYGESIEIFNKVASLTTPLEKLNSWLSSIASMKTTVLDYWKSKEELETMDDELPVVIYIVAMSNVESIASQVRFLQDYCGDSNALDNELRMLLNIEVSIRYIVDEWPNL